MKPRHALAVLMVVAVLAGTALGCKTKPVTTGVVDPFPTITAIKLKKKIIIGTSSGYFPFEMVDKQGKLIGFDIDMGKKIGEVLGVTVEWRDMAEFDALVPALEAGQLDLVIAGITITAKRALIVNYTIPYFRTGQAVLVNKNVKGVTKVQDLDKTGNVIAVARGTTGHFAAEKVFTKATLRVMDGSSTAGMEVLSGNAQAMVFDLDWVAIFQNDNATKTYALLDPITVENLGIAVRPGQWDMLFWVNAFLTEFVGNEDYQELYQYYFKDMPWKPEVQIGG
jgi:polar amino acid transport system substrate-binding protein